MEHPHEDSAWFAKSENNQCKASPQHSVTLLLDNFPQGAVAGIAALLRCGLSFFKIQGSGCMRNSFLADFGATNRTKFPELKGRHF